MDQNLGVKGLGMTRSYANARHLPRFLSDPKKSKTHPLGSPSCTRQNPWDRRVVLGKNRLGSPSCTRQNPWDRRVVLGKKTWDRRVALGVLFHHPTPRQQPEDGLRPMGGHIKHQ
jgi:hypothetical protein